LLQIVLELSNQWFILLFLVGAAIIFIVTSLTHTHDVDAEEVAIQSVEKIEQKVTEIVVWDSEEQTSWEVTDWPSWHKAPEGF
jgi:hypothetical protein